MFKKLLGSVSTTEWRLPDHDAKAVFQKYKDALEKQANQTLYATNSGVFTSDGLQKTIDEILSGEGRTTFGLISSQIGLDQEVLKPLIKQTKVPIYLNGSTIFCKLEVERIKQKILSELGLGGGVFESIKFCADNSLDITTLENMIKNSQIDCKIVDGLVVSGDCLSQTCDQILVKLKTLDAPIKLTDLTPIPVEGGETQQVNEKLWRQLLSASGNKWLKNSQESNGTVDGYGVFTPNSYKVKSQQDVLHKLTESGTLKITAFNDVGIKDVAKFCKQHELDVILLDQVIVTKAFLDGELQQHSANIEANKWTKVFYTIPLRDEETLIQKYLIPGLASKVTSWKDKSNTYLCPLGLLTSMINNTVSAMKTQAVLDSQAIIESCKKTKTKIDVEDTVLKETSKKLTEQFLIKQVISTSIEEPAVQKFISGKALKQSKEAYSSALEEALKSYKTKEDQQEDIKVQVYWNGVDSLKPYDATTHAILEEEMVNQYIHRPTMEFSSEDLSKFQQDQVSKYRKRLASAKDGTTVILIAVSIMYSEFFTQKLNKPVFLKTTGKNVPKLLKVLEAAGAVEESGVNMGILTSLKNAVRQQVQGEDLKSLIQQVKNGVKEYEQKQQEKD